MRFKLLWCPSWFGPKICSARSGPVSGQIGGLGPFRVEGVEAQVGLGFVCGLKSLQAGEKEATLPRSSSRKTCRTGELRCLRSRIFSTLNPIDPRLWILNLNRRPPKPCVLKRHGVPRGTWDIGLGLFRCTGQQDSWVCIGLWDAGSWMRLDETYVCFLLRVRSLAF